jgi:hypothetical protein
MLRRMLHSDNRHPSPQEQKNSPFTPLLLPFQAIKIGGVKYVTFTALTSSLLFYLVYLLIIFTLELVDLQLEPLALPEDALFYLRHALVLILALFFYPIVSLPITTAFATLWSLGYFEAQHLIKNLLFAFQQIFTTAYIGLMRNLPAIFLPAIIYVFYHHFYLKNDLAWLFWLSSTLVVILSSYLLVPFLIAPAFAIFSGHHFHYALQNSKLIDIRERSEIVLANFAVLSGAVSLHMLFHELEFTRSFKLIEMSYLIPLFWYINSAWCASAALLVNRLKRRRPGAPSSSSALPKS